MGVPHRASFLEAVFGWKVGLSIGPLTLGVKRMVEPALKIPELPKIDLVLLSHAHFDHFDLPSLRRLQNRGTVVVTASQTADLLRCLRFRALHELGWGERIGT